MAQTKRKRQTKHRGNAAGVVETRGRTSRPPSAEERKRADRAAARDKRLNTPPTWSGSFKRALLAAGLMFLVLLLIDKHGKGGNRFLAALVFAVLALALYVPGSYYMELFLYRRRTSQKVAKR